MVTPSETRRGTDRGVLYKRACKPLEATAEVPVPVEPPKRLYGSPASNTGWVYASLAFAFSLVVPPALNFIIPQNPALMPWLGVLAMLLLVAMCFSLTMAAYFYKYARLDESSKKAYVEDVLMAGLKHNYGITWFESVSNLISGRVTQAALPDKSLVKVQVVENTDGCLELARADMFLEVRQAPFSRAAEPVLDGVTWLFPFSVDAAAMHGDGTLKPDRYGVGTFFGSYAHPN